jgi:hypothetical protein
MNKLLMIGAPLVTALLIAGKKTPTSNVTMSKKDGDLYISEDGLSICNLKIKADINIGASIAQNKKLYDDYLKLHKESDIYDLARYRLSVVDKYNNVPEIIDISATDTVKYLYIYFLLGAAAYMVEIGKMSKPLFASWLFDEKGFSNTLLELGVLTYGDWYEDVINTRASIFENSEVVEKIIKNQFVLSPNLKNLSAEMFASLMIIMFSTIVSYDSNVDCTRIDKFIIADYTSFSDKGINPVMSDVYNKFFNIFLKIKQEQ